MGGSKPPIGFSAPMQMGVDMNSSNYGMPVAVVYGQNKVSGNCCWYGDFAVTQTRGGGKGGGGGPNSYDYHASYMLVMCEGPITAFNNAWQGSSFQPLSNLQPAFTTLGAIGQAPWSHFGGVQALGYSGFALIAFLNNDLGSQATTPNYQIEVNALQQYGSGITDADPSAICTDICTNVYHGIGFSFLGSLTQWHDYCVANGLFISPVYNTESTGASVLKDLCDWTNTQVYFSEGVLKFVPYGDVAVTGNSVTYTPNLTAAWNFTDADYVIHGDSPPITLHRKALPDCSNTVRIEYPDRSYYYYSEMVEARDEEDAITNGVRAMTSKHIDSITTAAVARFVAQNILQRDLYIRNTYEWKTSWRFAYLEPSDPVTLTDSTMGFTQLLVRITKVEEDEDGLLHFTAEELPIGVGHSENYNTQVNGGATINVNVDPGPVDIPVFFRAPGFINNQNSPAIGIALSGSTALWGAAQLYISYDGVNYEYKATIYNQARYGVTGTAIAVESDPDTVSTPNVTLEQGQLIGGTDAEADQLITLFMVDNEIMSYGTATLVSGETYTLGYLRRGAYNSTIASHLSGATFVRLDDNIFYLPIDPSLVGQTIYAKFLSFNAFGKTPRTLASETAYTYVVGTNTNLPDVPATPSSFAVTPAPDGVFLTWSNLNPAAVSVTSIERSATGTGSWTVIAQVGIAHTAYHDIWSQADLAGGKTYYYRARALGSLPQAGFSAYTSVLSSAAFASSLSSVTGNQSNFIPDSDLRYGYNYYPPSLDNSGGKWIISQFPGSNANAFEIAPGTYAAGVYRYSLWFYLPAGTYTLSVVGEGSANITSGSAFASIYSYTVGTGLVSDVAAVTFGVGNHADGRYSSTFTLATASYVVYLVDTNAITISGGNFYFGQPQLEPGSVMTGYRTSTDTSGYTLYQGSVPPTMPNGSFSYTSTTSAIDWSWTAFAIYRTDATSFNVNSGTQNYTGLTAATTYYFYPYYNIPNSVVNWGGFGTSKSAANMAGIQLAFEIPLCNSGISAATTSSGTGGGSGGGNKCLHPETQINARDSFIYDADAAEKTLRASELIAGRHAVLTPHGWAVIRQHQQAVQHDWIQLMFSNGEAATVTPSHVLQDAGGREVAARDLKLGTILMADGALVSVIGMLAVHEPAMTVVLDVPGHWFYARHGGVLHHNGNYKP